MFGPKLIIGGIVTLGAGIPLAVFLGEEKILLKSNEITFRRRVSSEEPILDCHDLERHYQVFLNFSGGWVGKESDVPILKIVVLKDISEGERGIDTEKEGKWSKWRITNLSPNDKGVYMDIPQEGHSGRDAEQRVKTVICYSSQFEWTNPQQVKWVDGKEIKLSLSGENCKMEIGKEGTKECNIDMSVSGDVLRWKTEFKPQAYLRVVS